MKALDVVDAFGPDEATFVPYWSVPQWKALAEEENLVVSAYVRKRCEVMLLVSNLSDEPRAARLRLDRNPSGLDKLPRNARDPLDNLPASLVDNELRLRVEGRDLRIVLLTSGD